MSSYRNAKEILPADLLEEIQRYIKGEIIYIPKRDEQKIKWGTKNGSRKKYDVRNSNIKELKRNGMTIEEIAGVYYLSADSIRKILSSG
ncbi:MAG: CD3324 family protein [Oscillospiraceae bacterium]|nr:CD3324 family protein [Oscillospiraceae bacterium]